MTKTGSAAAKRGRCLDGTDGPRVRFQSVWNFLIVVGVERNPSVDGVTGIKTGDDFHCGLDVFPPPVAGSPIPNPPPCTAVKCADGLSGSRLTEGFDIPSLT